MNTQEKAKWLSEYYAAIADGKQWQFLTTKGSWEDAVHTSPDVHSDPKYWRIKPEPREPRVIWVNEFQVNPGYTYLGTTVFDSIEDAQSGNATAWHQIKFIEVLDDKE